MEISGLGTLFNRAGPPEGTGPMTGRRKGYRDAGVQGLDITAPATGGFSTAQLKKMYEDLAARVLSARQAYINLKAKGYLKIPSWLTGSGRMMRHIDQLYYKLTGKRLGAAAGAGVAPALEKVLAALRPTAKPAVTAAAAAAPGEVKPVPYAALGIGAAIVAGAAWFMWGRK